MSDANTSQDSGSYVLDAENVAEMARLLVQDRLPIAQGLIRRNLRRKIQDET